MQPTGKDTSGWPLLFAGALLLILSGIRVAQTGSFDTEEALGMGAGLVMLGAWLAVEIRSHR